MPVVIGAEPFTHLGSDDVGVLLCHGFTGSPASMRPWAEHLAATCGFTVSVPRLPGHGTTWQELNGTTWNDWYGCLRDEFDDLRKRCSSVFVCGLSMGGTLTLRLAQERGTDIAGIVLVNPAVMTPRLDAKIAPLLRHVVPCVPGIRNDINKPGQDEIAYKWTPVRAFVSLTGLWKIIRPDLAAVTQPLLMLHSLVDHVVDPRNAQLILDGVGSADVTEIVLKDSFHVATLDNDAQLIYDSSVEFINRVHATRTATPEGELDAI